MARWYGQNRFRMPSRIGEEKGQTLVDYALLLLLVVLVVALAIPGFSTALNALYTKIAAAFTS